jgi:hypothetical protein
MTCSKLVQSPQRRSGAHPCRFVISVGHISEAFGIVVKVLLCFTHERRISCLRTVELMNVDKWF